MARAGLPGRAQLHPPLQQRAGRHALGRIVARIRRPRGPHAPPAPGRRPGRRRGAQPGQPQAARSPRGIIRAVSSTALLTRASSAEASLAERLDAALPQTQCRRCGYPDCRRYAGAIAGGEAAINRCPPGGAEGIARLAAITGRPPLPLDAACGAEGPRLLAVIDEAWCIGCTLCIAACPVDCIVGAPKRMHTVIDADCTGCELCVPACPVDCIALEPVSGECTGWQAWSAAEAGAARERYHQTTRRRERATQANEARLAAKAEAKLADLAVHSRHTDPATLDRKRAVIEAALARARARQAGGGTPR
ncbi:MAG: electron transport complex subunit RsxB [Burkholderiaceae bacterium]|nr:electron transport complex subunit RsxB [Burkholderiaceae bacterium]